MGCQLGIPPPFRRNADILPSASCKPQSYQGGRGRFGWGPWVQQKPGSVSKKTLRVIDWSLLSTQSRKNNCVNRGSSVFFARTGTGIRDPKIGPNISQKMPTMLPLQIAEFQILGYELLGYMQNSSETYSKISPQKKQNMMKWWNSWRSPSAARSRRAPGAPPSTLWTERPRSGAQANFYRS